MKGGVRMTLKEAHETLALLDKHGGSLSAMAHSLSRPFSTISSRVASACRRVEAEAKKTREPDHDKPLAEKEKVAFEDRIRALEKELKAGKREELTAEKISSYYFNLKGKEVELPDWVVTHRAGKGTAGVPVTNWSDWHYGEKVDPAQVEHTNEFSIKVFQQRFRLLVDRTLDLCLHHMTNTNYQGVVVNLGGDMISGHIHEELAKTNERETIPATLDLAGFIAWGLRCMADKFKHVLVVGVPGNHGRNTKKPEAKNACYTSFDWMVYKIVQSHLSDDDRFTFLIPDGFDAHYRVFNHRILLTHGDRIGSKGGDGFIGSIGPIMRGVKKLRLAYGTRGREIDTVLMGHWHIEWCVPGLRVNNTLKGYDEWAMANRFEPTPPSQDLFFVHPSRGITCSWPVQLEGKQKLVDSLAWASVAA